ncbi:MAG TPA: PRC-barrel domain-containing protein [Terriglobales bacterium]|nr:PRC-barrel domain-containing protein [Terriglobales bacterium]
MAIYGNLKDYRFDNEADDIRGADVYGVNGEKLGEIDDVIFDSLSGELKYVVIDTGGWLTSQRFIVPALQLTIREEGDEDYHINLTREQIERFPEYKEETLSSDDQWTDYEQRYERSIEDGPVMHVQNSTRMITPEPSQVESIGPVTPSSVDPTVSSPQRIAQDMPRFGATSPSDAMVTESGNLAGNADREAPSALRTSDRVTPNERRAMSRGRRFDDFQERLRRDRGEILRRRAA